MPYKLTTAGAFLMTTVYCLDFAIGKTEPSFFSGDWRWIWYVIAAAWAFGFFQVIWSMMRKNITISVKRS